MKSFFSVVLLLVLALPVLGGECVLKTTRAACPGKEKEAFSKCDGKATCEEKLTVNSEKDCAEKALKACEISRPGITRSKSISATFDGKPVDGGKNFCAADRPDFNKCE